MDPNEILKKILRRYGVLTENIRALQRIESRIQKKIATYADAEEASRQIGRALTTALKENLPDALTDGMLYRAIAEVIVEQPMKAAGKDVARFAEEIQREMNESAGIGINPIVPKMNQDQIDGIITGICNAESYETGKDTLFAQTENCLEGYVDDFVRENADFQYKAGLSPTIERRAQGNCCKWCSQLAGTYLYEEVKNSGNDVFKRHKYCHCQILFNPGNGRRRRQDTHTKRWTDGEKADRIAFAKRGTVQDVFQTTADPMREVYGSGEVSHPKQIAAYRKEAADLGVNIIERDTESLAYSPGLQPGTPGTLYISKGASYSGWTHEIIHMRDDHDAGWSGMRIMTDPDECFRREQKAYDAEIQMASAAERPDIVQRLKDNLEAERRHIYGLD